MERIDMALPLGSGLMMDEDAASIVAQIKTLLRQLKIKGATDEEIDSLLTKEDRPGTYTISPDIFLVDLKDEEGNTYSCTPEDTIEMDGYSITVRGIYDWYLYFNTYSDWTNHCMDKRFKARMFHRKGKELAIAIRMQMHPEDELFYFRSIDDDSGVIRRRIRIKHTENKLPD